MSRTFALATIVMAALGGSLAAGPLEDANAANEQGKQLYAARDYQAALAKFREAWALSRQARYMFNLASVLDDMGRNAEAIEAYELHLRHPDTRAEDATAVWAQKRVRELEPKTAVIRVSTGRPDATLTVGARDIENTGGLFVVRVDPGPAALIVRAGEQTESVVLTIKAGELVEQDLSARLTPVEVPVARPEPRPPPVEANPREPVATPVVDPSSARGERRRDRAPSRAVLLDPLGLAFAGSSLVALGVGAYFLQRSLADEGDLDAQPTLATHDALLERARDGRRYAGIGLALAGSLAAAAAVRYVWVARMRPALQVAVEPGRSEAVVSLGGSF